MKIFSSSAALILLLLLCNTGILAQSVISGPIVGGVTNTSARIFIESDSARSVTLLWSLDEQFSSYDSLVSATADSTFKTLIADLIGLQPDNRYYYRFVLDGVLDTASAGSFRSFPNPGDKGYLKLVTGSCNYFPNDALFSQIRDFDPQLFLHLGDWNWPPAQLGNDYNLYPEKQAASFKSRYSDYNMRKYVLPNIPVDYIYDDDFCYNDNNGATYSLRNITTTGTGETKTELITVPFDTNILSGAVEAYYRYFPAYPLADTSEGIYHKITLGNVDIFMLDERINMDPIHDAFVYDAGANLYSFAPGPTHSILGEKQRQWLFDELQNSTADWKILGSGLVFNKQYERIMNFGLNQFVQKFVFDFAGKTGTGVILAASIAVNWVGYPYDLNGLLDHLEQNNIEDVMIVSGDSHSSVLDDGTNSGIPEMNASGLAAGDEGYLNYYIDSIGSLFGFPPATDSLWNGGGNGVGNTNFSDTYGTIEVFEDDSLRMCVIDEFGQNLGCVTLTHSSKVTSLQQSNISRDNYDIRLIYPNPTKDKVHVLFGDSYQPEGHDRIQVMDLQGKIVFSQTMTDWNRNNAFISTKDWPAGMYRVVFITVNGMKEFSLVVD